MTLTKTKRRTSAAHRKRSAGHHHQSGSYIKPYWPYLPIVAIISFGMLLSGWIGNVNQNVLGYATGISVSGLLEGTNAQRAANALGSLALNATLNQAAQAKAADMAANDYWAHNSPSGATPWSFITAAGYSYLTAGENLAYGFNTSADTITGWMNSAGHRANILNTTYTEVGFGIIDIPDYQGDGPETLVVAMYASPSMPVTPVTTPMNTSNATSGGGSSIPTAVPSAPEPSTPTPTAEASQKQDTVVPTSSTKQGSSTSEDISASKPIARIQVLSAANVAWTQFALSMLVSVAVLIFLLRHSFAWHKVLVKGEQFVLHHPLLDIAFVAIATLGAILLQTSGVIR